MSKVKVESTAPTTGSYFVSSSPVTAGTNTTSYIPQGRANKAGKAKRTASSKDDVVEAVYGYIVALRHLGKDRINTSVISDALHIPRGEVIRAVEELKDRGVKTR